MLTLVLRLFGLPANSQFACVQLCFRNSRKSITTCRTTALEGSWHLLALSLSIYLLLKLPSRPVRCLGHQQAIQLLRFLISQS